jgi:hypothetical protein
MTAPQYLQVIGQLAIPSSVLDHRFAREAMANAMLLEKNDDVQRQVVGTENTRACELYGWMPNVDSHVDKTGFVYLACLNEGTSWVHLWPDLAHDDLLSVELQPGTVVRMNDHFEHWTEDKGPRIAAFVGSFDRPDDALALSILTDAVAALARGDYYGAPRVRSGFRVVLPDECYAANAAMDALDLMLLEDARRQNRLIELCAKCSQPAVRVDNHWPYHVDQSRCREHMERQEA